MKSCNGCGLEKPLDNYTRNRSRDDGRDARCKACRAAYRERNREKIARKKAADYVANRDRERAKRKRHREANPAAAAERHTRWASANPVRLREYQVAYRNAPINKARKAANAKSRAAWRLAIQNARRARQIQATPAWANLDKVAEFYAAAALVRDTLGEAQHVDHIVPLKSRHVCGLHNEFNLQILPAADNIAKGNRIWPDMW